mmetsp:Transcript_3243/g.9905  ORF Transcript_3243/g.9905 Transcript_3243/m.9905 type:complete len:288 (+) Transcript_3243:108-971(+)|eukprot:CAMPEP_0198732498 /NCGR_PEP_ID=MMETSP1475-20131203/36365_1 /TAXON_ID= ORGANISM="Unidentified sp., Strain CCMP1999" /NCGR_SAMPLE_ID=MMETSP1475 /ASSEMBLY_ACC=CAM_ASM_001111 /LENGTH=287 /DNA_ID=CAMNT_0044495635 /DNA_START=90 /DNA_END=953 /DNA_ORIENTATION=+
MGCNASRDVDSMPAKTKLGEEIKLKPENVQGFKLPDYENLKKKDLETKQATELLLKRQREEEELKIASARAHSSPVDEVALVQNTVEVEVESDSDSFISSEEYVNELDEEAMRMLEEELEREGIDLAMEEARLDEEFALEKARNADGRFNVTFADDNEVASGFLNARAAFTRKASSRHALGFEQTAKVTEDSKMAALQEIFEGKEEDVQATPDRESSHYTDDHTVAPELQEKVEKWKKARRRTKRKVKKEDMNVLRAPLQTEKIVSKYAPIYASLAPEYQTVQQIKV